MKKIFIPASILGILCQLLPLTASAQPQNAKSFTQWCQQSNSVSAATKQTIDLMLEKAGTQNCQQADAKLSRLSELYLSDRNIRDLQPLASLTNLKALFLNSNQISDISPLASLTNLKGLDLNANQISDLSPLADLTNLNTLFLNSNRVPLLR